MLPVAVVLIFLMRMDGMLLALRMPDTAQQEQQRLTLPNPGVSYFDAYDARDGLQKVAVDNDDDYDKVMDDEAFGASVQGQSFEQPLDELSEVERLKRCMLFKIGMSESLDIEERDIMKDARTSFLPLDTTAIPRECLGTMTYHSPYDTIHGFDMDKAIEEDMLKKRSRRTSDNDAGVADLSGIAVRNNEDASIYEDSASFQSFWNAHGTKELLRTAQARTMQGYMDTSVDPCVDFYKYSCGNWEKLHPIPKDKAGFDTFEMLRESLDLVLKQLLESNDPSTTSDISGPKVADVKSNQYNDNANRDADLKAHIVNTGAAAVNNEDQSKSSKSQDELLKAKAARLRRHIVRHRKDLSRILMRFKRQTTNTKRKRLVSYYTRSRITKNIASVVTGRNAREKAKYLYQSCTNGQLLAKRGIQPLLKLINDFGGWPVLDPHWNENHFDWINLTANLRRYNNDILIVQWVGPDIKNSDENIIQFDQTSLGLPTREYFLQEINAKYLNAYQVFMSEVMQKLGAPQDVAKRTAQQMITFETQLASITSPAEERLNVTKLYKRMTMRQLQDMVPAINWKRYLSILQERNVDDNEEVVIYATDYMHNLVNLLSQTEPRTVSNYLMWRFVRHRINNVDDRFEDVKQNFYHTLFGREESPSRWKVCIAQVNTNMGMAVGSMFVQKYFDENSKRDTLRMTHELQQAFRDILTTTNWLDAGTKRLAEEKVNAMSLKIGYPDFILNQAQLDEKYAGIDIQPDKYFENTLNVLLHTSRTEQRKLYEPVNKTNWQTAPAIVNAYYSRNKNQIMFPAGILQPPFYHRHFPRSLNFGGIGVVIGHELTHGFDDKGRLFDRNGSIHKWWTDAAIRGFDERARCIIAQYNNYTVGEVGINLNGESTQGENIADNGGIRQAFHAYKRWLKDNPAAAMDERLPGFNMTGEQLFFLNFGQVWCGAMRPEAVRNKLNTAIHSPGRFRVIGTVSNSYDFANEFKCPVGSPMNPVRKCAVW